MGRIITLTTDFGPKDHYAGAMKGALLSVNPEAVIADISHSVTAGDILGGAFVMAGACALFPPGTVHVGVVDPGVGGERRAVIVETNNFLFVGPDNGLLSLAAEADGIRRVIDIKNEKFLRGEVSDTFHGRDVFGPVAGHLSLGIGLEEFGPPGKDLLMINTPEPVTSDGAINGEVIHIDSYGNIITNISAAVLESTLGTGEVELVINGQVVKGPYRFYGELPPGGLGLLTGSSGLVEAAAREANGAQILKAEVGDTVRLVKS